MAIPAVSLRYIGQPSTAAAGQILANNNGGPLGRTLTGTATVVLDGSLTTSTINFIDGSASFGKQIVLPLQSVDASINTTASLTLTAVAASSGGNAVYTGTITGGGSNALVGYYFTVAGFVNAANNGVWIAVASTTTTLTLANPAAIAETHAGTAQAGTAAYHSTSADSSIAVGDSVVIAGFNNSANNGTFTVIATSATTVTVNNPSAVAETNPAATLSDVQNGTPVAVMATVSGGTQQATAYVGATVSTITSTGFTLVYSGAGTAGKTLNIVATLFFPGV
jgi:hypothetical protein